MGLFGLHRILVGAAIVMSAVGVAYAVFAGRGSGTLALGIGCGAMLVGLAVYLRWLVRKGLTGRRPA